MATHQAAVANVKTLLEYIQHPKFADDAAAALGEICVLADYIGEFTHKPVEAQPGRQDLVAAMNSDPLAVGTEKSSSLKSVAAGDDTYHDLLLSVKSLQEEVKTLTRRMNGYEAAQDQVVDDLLEEISDVRTLVREKEWAG